MVVAGFGNDRMSVPLRLEIDGRRVNSFLNT